MKMHTLWACAVVSLTITHATNAQTTRYVNGACGDDSWSGTQEACAAPDGPRRTIQAAIVGSSAGDTIIVADGVYTGSGGNDVVVAPHAITIRSVGGSSACTIDCQGLRRGVFMLSGALEGFTIMNGSASSGGGLHSTSADLLAVRDCQFIGNTASSGGAVLAVGANLAFRDCVFRGNIADVGGGVELKWGATGSFVNCVFEENQAQGGGVGAVFTFTDCHTDFVNCDFRLNDGDISAGAASITIDSTATFTNCSVSRNTSSFESGGLGIISGSAAVHNCSFSQNTGGAVGSGGLFSSGAVVTLVNGVLWNNEPHQIGGPIDVTFSDIQGGRAGEGNIDADPLFAQPGSDNLRLTEDSPCIDAGSTAALPPDMYDLDGDDDTTEPLPVDLDGNPRVIGAAVDMGAYEGESDAKAPSDEADDIDNGESVFLIPSGGAFNPPEHSAAFLINVAGPDDASAVLTEINWNLHPDAGGYTELGLILALETSLADGEHLTRMFISFTPADLGGVHPSDVDMTSFGAASGDWRLAVAANTQDSPGHDGPVGDRNYSENPDNDWGLTLDLGDYGVYWNPDLQRGFAWANVDFQGDFGFGEPICPGDCNRDGLVDPLDIAAILAEWGPTTGSPCDLDNDFTVGPDDLAIVLGSWGECDGAPPMPSGPNAPPPGFGRAVDAQNAWRDLNADNRFDAADIATILGHWGKVTEDRARPADLNGDHTVDRIDLDLLLDR